MIPHAEILLLGRIGDRWGKPIKQNNAAVCRFFPNQRLLADTLGFYKV